jgi:hypothetical protein
MSVNSPRFPGPYPQRAADCESAIERDFFRELVNANAAYVDVDRILAALADDATRAGWWEEDLTSAVYALARRHNIRTAVQP